MTAPAQNWLGARASRSRRDRCCGSHTEAVGSHHQACIEVNRLENEGDDILRNALATLFREATNPLLVLKWKEVYEALENATDRCEDVANIIEGVVLEHA
jgi:uncharacterized protein Yka (UPF0111/DUF47 family)